MFICERSEEERQLMARQRYLQEKKRMIILDESRAEEQARKKAGLARIEQVRFGDEFLPWIQIEKTNIFTCTLYFYRTRLLCFHHQLVRWSRAKRN